MKLTDKTDQEFPLYPTFYGTIVESKSWQDWGKVAHKYGYDWDESTECNWLSVGHWTAFINWLKKS